MSRGPMVFLDKDGTLVRDVPYNIDPSQIVFEDGVLEGLRALAKAGCRFVIVSNQSGVARGLFNEGALLPLAEYLAETLELETGARIERFYYCPHHPDGTVEEYAIECGCRKPQPGMLLAAIASLGLQPEDCWMVGDILNDVEAGKRAGCRTILIDNGNETEWEGGPFREPDFIAANLAEAAQKILTTPPARQPTPTKRVAQAPGEGAAFFITGESTSRGDQQAEQIYEQ